jgi:hypothetical protein
LGTDAREAYADTLAVGHEPDADASDVTPANTGEVEAAWSPRGRATKCRAVARK